MLNSDHISVIFLCFKFKSIVLTSIGHVVNSLISRKDEDTSLNPGKAYFLGRGITVNILSSGITIAIFPTIFSLKKIKSMAI